MQSIANTYTANCEFVYVEHYPLSIQFKILGRMVSIIGSMGNKNDYVPNKLDSNYSSYKNSNVF